MKRNQYILARTLKIVVWAFFLLVAIKVISHDRAVLAKVALCFDLALIAFTGDCLLDCVKRRKRNNYKHTDKRAA